MKTKIMPNDKMQSGGKKLKKDKNNLNFLEITIISPLIS
jgi:hypothetical protein